MNNRASQIIVLCEDKLHDVFVRRFLKKWGVANRTVRVLDYPQGAGSGAAYVIANYPEQLKAVRSRSAGTALIVVVDADNRTVKQRADDLKNSLKQASMPDVGNDEPVCCVIPKRSIDTWLKWLQGDSVDEEMSYKQQLGFRMKESEAHSLIDILAEKCRRREKLETPPDSLSKACGQFEKIRSVLSGA